MKYDEDGLTINERNAVAYDKLLLKAKRELEFDRAQRWAMAMTGNDLYSTQIPEPLLSYSERLLRETR